MDSPAAWDAASRARRPRIEQELALHLELQEEDARRRGLDPVAAARTARLKAGGAAQAMEALRDRQGVPWIDDLTRDVRPRAARAAPQSGVHQRGRAHARARHRRQHGDLLDRQRRPPATARLSRAWAVDAPDGPGSGTRRLRRRTLAPGYVEFRELNRSFAHVGAFTTGRANTGGGAGAWTGEVNITAGDRPMRVRSAAVDHHLVLALGVRPAHGRFFAPGETDAMASRPGLGGPPIAVLSHELWLAAFGSEPVVGRTIAVDGRPHDVIGIMPPGVDLMDTRPEIWLPIGVHPVIRRIRTNHFLNVIGRLKDGVTPQMAGAELNAFLQNWSERAEAKGHVPTSQPTRAEDHLLHLQPLQDAIVGEAGRAIWLLQAAVGFVLLIVCANLANLALARSEARRREFAVVLDGARRGPRPAAPPDDDGRSGAGDRRRRARRLAGWRAPARPAARLSSQSAPHVATSPSTCRCCCSRSAVSMATGLFFAFAPIGLRRVRDLLAALRDGNDRAVTGGARRQIRRALVAIEVALAVMLVTSAGLLLRSLDNLVREDPGFDRSRLVTFSMTLPRASEYPGGRAQVYRRLLETLRAAPGVQAATAMSDLPLDRFVQGFATRVESDPPSTETRVEIVDYYQFVMADYFSTMGIPIVAGRGFTNADTASKDRRARRQRDAREQTLEGTQPDRAAPPPEPVGVAGHGRQPVAHGDWRGARREGGRGRSGHRQRDLPVHRAARAAGRN